MKSLDKKEKNYNELFNKITPYVALGIIVFLILLVASKAYDIRKNIDPENTSELKENGSVANSLQYCIVEDNKLKYKYYNLEETETDFYCYELKNKTIKADKIRIGN